MNIALQKEARRRNVYFMAQESGEGKVQRAIFNGTRALKAQASSTV